MCSPPENQSGTKAALGSHAPIEVGAGPFTDSLYYISFLAHGQHLAISNKCCESAEYNQLFWTLISLNTAPLKSHSIIDNNQHNLSLPLFFVTNNVYPVK